MSEKTQPGGDVADEGMSNEESYHFDAFGYLIVRDVLPPAELERCVEALERIGLDEVPAAAAHRYPFLQLRDHPGLVRYATELCGDGFQVDGRPRLVGRGRGEEEALGGGREWVDWSRAYRHDHGVRLCQRLQAYWALADVEPGDGGLVLIPASHNSLVAAPPEVTDGTDDMGLVEQPALKGGDLLLVAGNTVQGARPWRGKGPQRLLGWSYIAAGVRPTAGSGRLGKPKALPEWTWQLTPEQRAVVHNPDPDEPQLHVTTDGEKSWIEEKVDHPSIYRRDPGSGIDEREFYHWDLCGHLVVSGVMDKAWLRDANAAIDAFPQRISKGPTTSYGDSKSLKSEGHRSGMSDLWNLPAPHCEPFRRMIAHPALIQRLNWMMGSGYGVTQCTAFLSEKGGSGFFMHSGGWDTRFANHYEVRNGRAYCEWVNVVWQLRDVKAEDGGFAVVPGTHKGRYPTPEGITTMDDDPMGMVKHVPMKAGDVLFFLASAQTHGAFAWQGEQSRRGILMSYRSRNVLPE